MGFLSKIGDRLTNVMSGLGTSVDRRTAASYVFNPITPEQSEAAYRTSWIVKKLVDIPAKDMTREWRDWQAEADEIEALEKAERKLKVRSKCLAALIAARIYGGAAIYIGTGDNDQESELKPESIQQDGLRYLRVMTPQQLSVGPQRLDPEDPYVDQPEWFEISASYGRRLRIHPSRFIIFLGQKMPEGCYYQNGSGGWFWGDPVLQAIKDAVANADTAQNGFAALIDEASLDILRMPGLTEISATAEGERKIINRLTATKLGKSTWRALLLDKEDEFEQRQITWAGIPDTMMSFLELVCGAADIPVTRFLGQSPKGLASTGEGEERDYHAMVKANQDEILAPALDQLDEILIRSTFGSRNEEIHYLFAPLSELNEKDAATVEKQIADTLKTYGDTGLIHEEALAAIARNKMIEGGRWPGCEGAFEDVKNALAEGPTPEEEAEALKAANENTVGKLEESGRITKAQADELMLDARPRSLYVKRELVNTGDFLAWAKAQGFESTLDANDLHVTVLYSRAHVDWLKMGNGWESDAKGQLRIPPGGARIVEPLGDKGAIVLLFAASALSWRHEEMVRQGASHDYEAYQPHVTITYQGSDVDLSSVEPYRGELVFGPEIFEEVDDDWSSKIIEAGSKKKIADVHHWGSQARAPKGSPNGGQWIRQGASAEPVEGERELEAALVVPMTPEAKAALIAANEGKTIEQLHAEALANQKALRDIGTQIAKASGADFHEPPKGFEVKTIESIERKVRDEGYSGPHELTDLSRATITVDSRAEADRAVNLLAERGRIIDRGWNKIESTNYLDRKVYLQHPNGGVSEIQIVPEGVYQLKASEGHKLYEIARLPTNPMPEREAALARSRELYGAVLAGTEFDIRP